MDYHWVGGEGKDTWVWNSWGRWKVVKKPHEEVHCFVLPCNCTTPKCSLAYQEGMLMDGEGVES